LIRVLVVDDSAIVRKVLTEELSNYEDIEVVGNAVDPYAAREKIVKLRPDVITLDLEMPRMDGLTFLAKLMKYQPMPVIVVSSLAPENSKNALNALALGAMDIVSKPGSAYSTPDVSGKLVQAIRAAASARMNRRPEVYKQISAPLVRQGFQLETTNRVLAIGASTGGTKAIEAVLAGLPADGPGTAIVQHMPDYFTAVYAEKLNDVCKMRVSEARDGDYVVTGKALIAPGGKHMLLERMGANYLVRIKDGPAVHYQRPSVDVLFQSTARSAGGNAVGVLLTGMGADGARGLLAMRKAGAHTIAQNEETCVVFGMPGVAVKLGAAAKVLPLPDISQTILDSLRRKT